MPVTTSNSNIIFRNWDETTEGEIKERNCWPVCRRYVFDISYICYFSYSLDISLLKEFHFTFVYSLYQKPYLIMNVCELHTNSREGNYIQSACPWLVTVGPGWFIFNHIAMCYVALKAYNPIWASKTSF